MESTIKSKTKVMLLHNIVSPYRLPLFEELSKKCDLTVYFCKENDKERKWSTKLEGYSFKYKILPHKSIGNFVYNYTLKEELESEDYDVYICVDNPEGFFQYLRILSFCKRKNKKFIFWSGNTKNSVNYYKELTGHGVKRLVYNFKRFVEDICLNKVRKTAKSIISYSNATTYYLKSKGFDKNKIFTGTQNYPEYLLIKPTWKKRPNKFKDKKIILYVGYLREDKGVNYLIEAFNGLNKKDVLLLIAGSGDEENKLKELAKNNKNIIFLGYRDGVDRANYYSIADFFVFPSLQDVWGHVITESFYYGVPVISTNKPEAKELIEESKTGLIIPDRDVGALKVAMEKLIYNKKLLNSMKENVKRIPKSKIVDINTSVKTFERAIDYALKNHANKKK